MDNPNLKAIIFVIEYFKFSLVAQYLVSVYLHYQKKGLCKLDIVIVTWRRTDLIIALAQSLCVLKVWSLTQTSWNWYQMIVLDVYDNDIHYAVTTWINAEVFNIRNMEVFIQHKIKSMVHSWVQILETQKTFQALSNTRLASRLLLSPNNSYGVECSELAW